MDEQNMDILERIRASYYQFTTAERRVADFVLAKHRQVQFMSITQLAEECGTAEATVSRFCRSLKLKGFNAFKIELARCSGTDAAPRQEGPVSMDTLSGRVRESGRMVVEAVQRTMDLMDLKQITRAVEIIEQAPTVLCLGSGGSMIMALDCAHLFSTVSPKFCAVSDAHMQISAVATMDPKGVILLFSYSGATTGGLQILELARQRGIRTVLITRFQKSPAAKLADVVLRCGSNESPFQFGSVQAKVAQLVVVDAIFQEYCLRNRESCQESIQAIASALSVLHV